MELLDNLETVADVMFQVLFCPCGYKTCGWQVQLCDPVKHEALLERFEDLQIIIALYKYSYYITFMMIMLIMAIQTMDVSTK